MINLSNTNLNDYLNRFFEEKEIAFKQFEIKQGDLTHIISTEEVINLIKKAPREEKNQVVNILRKIDFKNGKIEEFLQHLAEGYIKTNY
jgi:hypothetical protein